MADRPSSLFKEGLNKQVHPENTQSSFDVLKHLHMKAKASPADTVVTTHIATDEQITSRQISRSKFDIPKRQDNHADTQAASSREIRETIPVSKEYTPEDLYNKTKHVLSGRIHDLDKHLYPPYWANETEKIMRAQFGQISPEGRVQLQRYARIIDSIKDFEDPSWPHVHDKQEKATLLASHQRNLLNSLEKYKNGHIRIAIEEYLSWKNHRINHYLRYTANRDRTKKNSALENIPDYEQTIKTLNNPEIFEETKTLAKNIGKVFTHPDAVLPANMVLKKDIPVAKVLPFLRESKGTTQLSSQHEGQWWVDDAYNSTSIYLDHLYRPAFSTSSDNNTRPKTATLFIKADSGMPGFFARELGDNPKEGEVLLPGRSSIQFEKIHDFDLSALSDRDRRILSMPDHVVIARYREMPETAEA